MASSRRSPRAERGLGAGRGAERRRDAAGGRAVGAVGDAVGDAADNAGYSAVATVVEAVGASLRRLPDDATVVVALSGGVDSVVLLDALAQCHPPGRIVACHVHHGLQAQADQWPASCKEQARRIGVSFAAVTVESRPRRGENVEAWARAVRYRALWQQVERVDAAALLTAHQADDQLETVLMRLARGSGPEALGAMSPAQLRHGRWLLRPLLAIGRETIVAHAKSRALQWIDDPMNEDQRFLRVALRTQLIPQFRRAVPALRENVLRSAQWLRECGETLRWLAERDLREAGLAPDARAVDRRGLSALPPARRDRAVRAWVETLGATMPNRGRLEQWIAQMVLADSAFGELVHEGWRFRRHRDRIVVEALSQSHDETPAPFAFVWHGEAEIALPAWRGRLLFETETLRDAPDAREARDAPRAPDKPGADWLAGRALEVRAPRGTARLRPRPGGPSRTLKNLFQEHAVPPWLRARMPALYAGDRLLYVAGLGMDRSPFGQRGDPRVTIRWIADDPEDPRAAFGEGHAPV